MRDAHSLYLETFSELGAIGLALLVVVLAVPLAVLPRVRHRPGVPLVAGAYVALLVHAAVDWDWEVPAVMLLGIFAGAVILAAMPDDGYALFGRLRVALVGCALVLGAAGFFGLVGQMVLSRAQNAAGQADWPVAARDAHRATSWLPWSPQPWQQLGEAQLAQGKPDAARASFRSAIEKDSGDWNLWFDLARASTGRAQADALAHAARLNPLSPEIAALRSELAAQ